MSRASVKPYSLRAAAFSGSACAGSSVGFAVELASQPENEVGRSEATSFSWDLDAAFGAALAALMADLGGCAILVGICAAAEATARTRAARESGMQYLRILL